MYMEALAYDDRMAFAQYVPYGDLEAIEAAIVKAVVRGEQPVGALKQTTVHISARGLVRTFGSPAELFVSIKPCDLAAGLLALKSDPSALAEWARFIVVTSDSIACEDRHTAYCDRLFHAIWDLAFGAPVGAAMIHLARTICSCFSKE